LDARETSWPHGSVSAASGRGKIARDGIMDGDSGVSRVDG